MRAISSLDVLFLVRELQILEGGKFNKIYAPTSKNIVIDAHCPRNGRTYFTVHEKYIFLSTFKQEMSSPSGFCMYLRKHFHNARIVSVEQVGVERIIKITCSIKVAEDAFEERYIFVELFGKGNVVITTTDLTILALAQKQIFKDRDVSVGKIYVYPEKEIQFTQTDEQTWIDILTASQQSLVKTLAATIGLGGTYAEEICHRMQKKLSDNNEDFDKDATPTAKTAALAYQELQTLMSTALAPQAVINDDVVTDIIPFPLETYKDKTLTALKTISEGFEQMLAQEQHQAKEDDALASYSQKIKKLESILSKQEKIAQSAAKQIDEETRKAELLFEHYETVQDILTTLNDAKKKHSVKDMQEKLKGHKIIKKLADDGKSVNISLE